MAWSASLKRVLNTTFLSIGGYPVDEEKANRAGALAIRPQPCKAEVLANYLDFVTTGRAMI
jgi:hypothetical protein